MSDLFLVIGSTGLLGQSLVKELRKQNKNVKTLARKNADICLDISQEKLLQETLSQLNPSVIINTAAIVDLLFCEENPDHAYATNAAPSKYIADYCSSNNVKYIYISTDNYYKNDHDQKHCEDDPLTLKNQYAITKKQGEDYALSAQDALVIRTNIVGFRYDRERPTFVEWAINALRNKEKMMLFEDFYTSSIDVNSLSKAISILIEKDVQGILNVASSEVSSKSAFIKALAKKLSLSLENTNEVKMLEQQQTIDRNESLGLDVSKAEKILGYKLPNLSEVIDSLGNEYLEKNNETL